MNLTPHPGPLPIGWREGVRKTGEGFVRDSGDRLLSWTIRAGRSPFLAGEGFLP